MSGGERSLTASSLHSAANADTSAARTSAPAGPGGQDDSPRRALRINWILPGTGLAGGVKSTRLLAEAMVARGHDITIAYADDTEPWPSPLRAGAFARRAMAAWKTRGKQTHHLEKSTARLIHVSRRRVYPDDVPDADFVVGTWWETMEWIRDWPASKGIKAHFIRHYETFGGDPARVKATYRMGTQKFVIAKWLQRLMAEEYGDPNAVLVPNGVDWDQFQADPRGKAPVPTVGLLYSWVKWKDTETAFEAIRIARQKIPNLKVIAFGNKPLHPEDRPPSNLEFHLRPSQEQIPRLYQKADCWLVSSISEGFGMPGLEAAACRCPVISTRCGGPEDYIRDGESGHLVDVGKPRQMADRILDVVSMDDTAWRRMSEASLEIARGFRWDRSAEILERALLAAAPAATDRATAALA